MPFSLVDLSDDELDSAIREAHAEVSTAPTERLAEWWTGPLLELLIERERREQELALLEAEWDGHRIEILRLLPWPWWIILCSCGWRSWHCLTPDEAGMVASWHVWCGGDPRKVMA